MGIRLQHMGITKATEKSRTILARMIVRGEQGEGTVSEQLQEVNVPKSLTAYLDHEVIEVRTWFFNKALKPMTRREGFPDREFIRAAEPVASAAEVHL